MSNSRGGREGGAGSKPDLVVVGELNADLILERLNDSPALGKERIAQGMTLTLGSSSAILAANASRLGLDGGFIGCIGADSFGAFVRGALEDAGVDVSKLIARSDQATGLTVIYTYTDDRGMLTYPGAMESLSYPDLPLPYLKSARHLHLSSFYLQPALPGTIRTTRSNGKLASRTSENV